jgi:hypothetical protein
LLSHAFVPSQNMALEAMLVDRSRLLGCTFIRDVLLHRCKECCQAGLGVPFHPRQVAVVHSPLEKNVHGAFASQSHRAVRGGHVSLCYRDWTCQGGFLNGRNSLVRERYILIRFRS